MLVVWCVLFDACCLLFADLCSTVAVGRLLCSVCCLMFVAYWLLCVVRSLLRVVCGL